MLSIRPKWLKAMQCQEQAEPSLLNIVILKKAEVKEILEDLSKIECIRLLLLLQELLIDIQKIIMKKKINMKKRKKAKKKRDKKRKIKV